MERESGGEGGVPLAARFAEERGARLLLFGSEERGPDDDFKLQFEAVSRFDEEEKQVVRSLLEAMILKHEARRWQSVSNGGETK